MSTYMKAKRNSVRSGVPAPFMLIVNWLIPGEPRYNQVNYFVLKEEEREPEYEKMLQHFLMGPNDAFRHFVEVAGGAAPTHTYLG